MTSRRRPEVQAVTASSTGESGEQSPGGDRTSRASRAKKGAERGGRVIVFLAAAAALFVGVVLLREVWIGTRVAAPFTRIGGATHVETAMYASRFWLTTPMHVVFTPAGTNEQTMLGAAQCAMANDAPLLFMRKNQTPKQLTKQVRKYWNDDATAHRNVPGIMIIDSQAKATACVSMGRPADASGLLFLPLDHPLLQLSKIPVQPALAPRVVFAAAWEPGFIPDIAVGLALGAHMATPHQLVSLIVIPRYLEADRELEKKLEHQRKLVSGGVVLGQTVTVPDDTRALLRQLLPSTDKQGFLKEVDGTLGSVEPLVGAALALIGLGAAVETAPKAGPQLAKLAYQGAKLTLALLGTLALRTLILILQVLELARKILVRAKILKPRRESIVASLLKGLTDGATALPAVIDWRSAIEKDMNAIVWLRSGTRAVGIVNQWYPAPTDQAKKGAHAPTPTILRLNQVELTTNDASSERVEFLLIPVADIELVAKSYTSPPAPAQPAPVSA